MARRKREYHYKSQVHRRAYFREYVRKNKQRLKAISLMGDIGKIIKTQNQLTQSIEDNTELMKKEQIKLDFKLKQVKDFLNIK